MLTHQTVRGIRFFIGKLIIIVLGLENVEWGKNVQQTPLLQRLIHVFLNLKSWSVGKRNKKMLEVIFQKWIFINVFISEFSGAIGTWKNIYIFNKINK